MFVPWIMLACPPAGHQKVQSVEWVRPSQWPCCCSHASMWEVLVTWNLRLHARCRRQVHRASLPQGSNAQCWLGWCRVPGFALLMLRVSSVTQSNLCVRLEIRHQSVHAPRLKRIYLYIYMHIYIHVFWIRAMKYAFITYLIQPLSSYFAKLRQ